MRILDRYILKTLILPVFFCVYTFILLYLIADVFDHLSEIVRNEVPLMPILHYYSLLIPFGFTQTISWATLLGTIYVFITFSKHNELIAMKSSGITISAIAKPFLFLGFCISILTFIVGDRVVPYTQKQAENIKTEYLKISNEPKLIGKHAKNIALLTSTKQLFVKKINTETFDLTDIRIHYLSESYNIVKRIVSKSATWTGNKWKFHDVSIYELGPEKKIIGEPLFFPNYELPEFTIIPDDLLRAAKEADIKSINDVRESIAALKRNGLDFTAEIVDFHEKLSTPWANLTLMLLIIPVLAKSRVRKGYAIIVISCIGVAFAFHLVYAVSLAFGRSGTLPPFLSAWGVHFIAILGSFTWLKKANY